MVETSQTLPKTLGGVAVIATVLNERSYIKSLLDSLFNQSLTASEIVITDAGSTDGTWEFLKTQSLKHLKLRVYQISGNRSIGRNYAIAKTSKPIIAITDAGCIPDRDWLFNLCHFFADPDVKVVSGFYRGHASNPFQKCLLPYVLVMPDKAGLTEFFPSTRSMAIRRSVFNRSKGFNPDIDPGEDYEFAHYLKKLGVKFTFAPHAVVTWHTNLDLSRSWWMFLRFAFNDIHSGIFRPRVKYLAIRYVLFVYLVFLSLQIPSILPLIPLLILIYFFWAFIKNYRYTKTPSALFWLPTLQIVTDTAVLLGTVTGILSYSKQHSRI